MKPSITYIEVIVDAFRQKQIKDSGKGDGILIKREGKGKNGLSKTWSDENSSLLRIFRKENNRRINDIWSGLPDELGKNGKSIFIGCNEEIKQKSIEVKGER